jgi:hypothetical protein
MRKFNQNSLIAIPGVANPNWCLGRNLKILPKLEAFRAA